MECEMSNGKLRKVEVSKMANDSQIEKWCSMDTITDYLDVSRETILQWINNRSMPAHKVGRLWKFKISEVDEWIKSGGASIMNKTDDSPKEGEE
jgi:excisionase family DNA binding protein